jgi:hypothetical protein
MYVGSISYILDEKVGPETFSEACKWPLQPINVMKKVVWRFPLEHVRVL